MMIDFISSNSSCKRNHSHKLPKHFHRKFGNAESCKYSFLDIFFNTVIIKHDINILRLLYRKVSVSSVKSVVYLWLKQHRIKQKHRGGRTHQLYTDEHALYLCALQDQDPGKHTLTILVMRVHMNY